MTTNTLEMTAPLTEQNLTQAELDRALLYLDQTECSIVGAIRNLNDAQWNFKPGAERWSPAEILEHVLVVLGRLLGPVREKLEQSPAVTVNPDYRIVDDLIIFQFPNRLAKFPSPFQPGGGIGHAEAIRDLHSSFAALKQFVATTPGPRNRSLESMPLKAVSNGVYDSMDSYQWVLAAAAHTERHAKQVLEAIADPAFPA